MFTTDRFFIPQPWCAVLAVAEAEKKSGRDILTACIAGYEVGIRVGEFLGRSHYTVFHTTGTAGTIAAAAAVGRLIGLDAATLNHALGSAGTQAAGLWEFLADAADSKQLHTANAAANGIKAAFLARSGFKGAVRILEGAKGMAAGMSDDADPARLTDRLGTRWAAEETSFKWHAACRHAHPAADALQDLLVRERLVPDDIVGIEAQVHQGAIDVLSAAELPQTVNQSKFSMGTVLGLIAVHGRADVDAFDRFALADEAVADFRSKVTMTLDEEVDRLYPRQWIGKVTVSTRDQRQLTARVDVPKGDPANTLTYDELEAKAVRLSTYSGGASEQEIGRLATRIQSLERLPSLSDLLSLT